MARTREPDKSSLGSTIRRIVNFVPMSSRLKFSPELGMGRIHRSATFRSNCLDQGEVSFFREVERKKWELLFPVGRESSSRGSETWYGEEVDWKSDEFNSKFVRFRVISFPSLGVARQMTMLNERNEREGETSVHEKFFELRSGIWS